MRTTIEMKPAHRVRLAKLAATRGEKGLSNVVAEALDLYLEAETKKREATRKALALEGSLTDEEADELRERTRTIRESWR